MQIIAGIPCVYWRCVSETEEGTSVSDRGSRSRVPGSFPGTWREWQPSKELYCDLQRFNCAMYCKNARTNEVYKLRYRLFCLKKGDVDSNQLPPCDDSFRKHALRANYQAAIFNDAPKYLRLLDVTGTLKMVGWRLLGWVVYQPRKQFWNYCLASAAGPVSFYHALVWQMA